MTEQKSKLIYAELKNGSTYKYVWLGNDTFAKEFAEWDHDSHEGKWKDMYEFDEKISYYFDHNEFKKVSDILGWDVEEGLEDAEIVEYETEDINWVVTGSGYMRMGLEDILIPNRENIKITSVVATDNFGNTYESSAYFVYYESEDGEEMSND